MLSLDINNDKLVTIKESCSVILNTNISNIKYELNDTNASILVFNNNNDISILNESGVINNSQVNICYLQLDRFDFKQNTNIVVKENSKLYVNTTYLGVKNKEIVFDLINDGSDSLVEIANNIVCLNDANFSLDCIGTIKKGSKRSICHQKSKCLTIEKPNKAKVLPILNIDENDVEASHSLSSGTIDDEIMFYMNSRGLDKKEALKLILESYLMPSEDYYRPYTNGEYIKEIANKKVEDICLI